MELDLTTPAQPPRTADMVSRYMTLTKDVMPRLARTTHSDWPVRNDHCFQRIVLDTICVVFGTIICTVRHIKTCHSNRRNEQCGFAIKSLQVT